MNILQAFMLTLAAGLCTVVLPLIRRYVLCLLRLLRRHILRLLRSALKIGLRIFYLFVIRCVIFICHNT